MPHLPKSGVAPSFRPVRRPPAYGREPEDAVVAQLVRAPVCGTGGRWFEPTQLYHSGYSERQTAADAPAAARHARLSRRRAGGAIPDFRSVPPAQHSACSWPEHVHGTTRGDSTLLPMRGASLIIDANQTSGGMMMRFGSCGVAMLTMLAAASLLPATASAYTAEQQQACTGDAFRFCSAEIPNIDRITACMVRHRAELSPACRAQFPGGSASGPGLGMAAADSSVTDNVKRRPTSWRMRKLRRPVDDDE